MGSLNPVNKSFCLEKLCESNFYKLMRLVPDLVGIEGSAIAHAHGKPSLHLKVLEKAPYTLTLDLSHHFDDALPPFAEPAVKVRVYLDVKTVEVLCDAFRPPARRAVSLAPDGKAVMNYKWSLNYFLDKWLSHCLQSGYRFDHGVPLRQAV